MDDPESEKQQVSEVASMLVHTLKMNLYRTKAAMAALSVL
jgi:hypothetical protein